MTIVIYLSIALLGIALGILFGYIKFSKKIESKELEVSKVSETFVRDTKKNYKEEYKLLNRRLHLLNEIIHDGFWDWDIPKNYVYWSSKAKELLGIDKYSIGGREEDGFDAIKKLMHEDDVLAFSNALRASLVADIPFNIEVRVRRSGNASIHYRILFLSGIVRRDAGNSPVQFVGSLHDISNNKQMEEKLIANDFRDNLTGVFNRKYFMQNLERMVERASSRQMYLFAVIVLDVDNFKDINDNFGNSVGNDILKEIAKRLEDCRRSSDFVARTGGDEFSILLDGIKNAGDATNVATRIQSAFKESFIMGHEKINVTASMGIAFNNQDGLSNDEIFANANSVLKKAKRISNGHCEVFTRGMREKVFEGHKFDQKLRKALDDKKLCLMYQPIINLHNSESVSGFEALVRWNDDEMGLISPADFIPMAEETGIIETIGEWILTEACEQTKAWVDAGYYDITVAVNFSAKQFNRKNLPASVKRVLESTELDARNLKVEITETTAMNSVDQTIETLTLLSKMGVHISIDDFGTGYSSLSYLKSYPINHLKVDRSFIKDIPHDKDDMAITNTIISMAHNLGLSVIAEGVEEKEQLEFLRERGCQYIQGYYFSKPLLAQDATEFLEKYYKPLV